MNFETLLSAVPADAQLRAAGPASSREIDDLEARVGSLGPLRDLLQWQNGGGSDLWLGPGFWFLLSAKDIIKFCEEWRAHEVTLRITEDGAFRYHNGLWPKVWLPFATWNSDVFLVLDESFKVLAVDILRGAAVVVDGSLQGFLDKVAALLIEGRELDVDELLSY